ncbi:uncharacterized protein EI90DRAFT_2941807, partial [Cantharellus anzutake]|uniref:uncharacterized protein n=1 Tax=Cantharellus anzutake TaxID=1750568 RepID=UPI001905E794
ERWLPIHTVDTMVSTFISLCLAQTPSLDSPANVDAAASQLLHFYVCSSRTLFRPIFAVITGPIQRHRSLWRPQESSMSCL